MTLSVDNANIPEGGGAANVTASLSGVAAIPVTVELSLSGSAISGDDYTASDTQIVINAGATSGAITVNSVDDSVDEPDESVIVAIENVINGTELGDQQQTITIADDDEPVVPNVTLNLDNSDIAEDGGVATLTIVLSESTTVPVSVELGFSGTASGSDYATSATQVVIAPDSTSATVTITAIQDEDDEPDDTVIVTIANVINGNEDGDQEQTITILDDDIPPSFAVTSLVANPSGFHIEFASELDASEINLVDTPTAGMGPADLVVVGNTTGQLTGSLVIGGDAPAANGLPGAENHVPAITFLATGGPLPADDYTVTLRSADDAFKDTNGALLDGDADGNPGGDYVGTFTIGSAPPEARTIGLPDFVRGPEQAVNVPADATGIPVTLSDGTAVRAVDLHIRYDPDLLTITGATAPAGGSVAFNGNTPGLAILVFFSAASLDAGEVTFLRLEAEVPADAEYGAAQVLDVHNVIVGDGNDNEFPATVDNALHLTSYFADASGNSRINAADAAQVAQFAALISTGFNASLNIDPTLVGDVSGNGRVNAGDASLVARFAALIPVDEIPALPAGGSVARPPGPVPDDTQPLVVTRPTHGVAAADLETGRADVSERSEADVQVAPAHWNVDDGPALASQLTTDRALNDLAEEDYWDESLRRTLEEIVAS